jgi:DNA topoisomerase-1
MKNLIIVESPTKARTLSKFLDKDYQVAATMGHVKDLPKSQLGVDVKHKFKPDYIIVPKQTEIVSDLINSAKKSQTVFLATDPDREGEAIAEHVKEVIVDSNSKTHKLKFQRIVFHEITKEALYEALKSPRQIDNCLVDAQVARRVLDRLVGYKLSPLLWKKVRRGLSAGRVQSVAVRLIVEREREIEAFKKEEYWEIGALLEKKTNLPAQAGFLAMLIKVTDKNADVKNEAGAKKIVSDLEKSSYKVFKVTKREIHKKPYAPFTTSTLTQAGARLFGWSAKRTMSIAQKLYEEGLITYHRTDSVNLSLAAVEKARDYISREFGADYLPPEKRLYKVKSKSAQEAHEAIRPTDLKSKVELSNSKFANDMTKLYDLIWKRFLACQMSSAVYDQTTVDVEAKYAKNVYLLRASGQIMKFDGWRKLFTSKNSLEEETVNLPDLSQDEDLKLIKVHSEQKFTQPPPRFNEASLIKTLEKLDIGRPSTYAPTISVIQIRQYVEKDEGKFMPTPIGIAVNDFLIKNFPGIFDYGFTADMENDLDKIAEGKLNWVSPIEKLWKPFSAKIGTVEKNAKRVKIETEKLGKKCPDCKKGELVVRTGRFGKFISCSRFPDCKYTDKYLEKINMKCPNCSKGEVIIKKTKKGRKFFGCSRYPECDWASWTNPREKKDESENQKN